MPRGARLAFANSFHHVFNRGINKQPIFLKDRDYQFFLKKILDLKGRFDHSLYAYCLMPNHFHLSIQTRKTAISKIMASLGTSYSMYFNRNYNHFGPVFQNRFKSILIESDPYFLQLSRYIYLNPLKAGLASDPFEYKYSSIREALGKEPLAFLDKDIVRLIGDSKASKRAYEDFVLAGLSANLEDMERLFEGEEKVAGSGDFATRARRKYVKRGRKK